VVGARAARLLSATSRRITYCLETLRRV
jgi:hypothetical protein